MRVVAGRYRGRRLVAPSGATTRPTGDRVREALFSIIGPIDGVDVLDVFAGSGALGIEALSRGAASATFVDSSPAAVKAIRTNTEMVENGARVRIVCADWRRALRDDRRAGRTYGLCLLDPPYTVLDRILGPLGDALAPVLSTDATLVVEYATAIGPVTFENLAVSSRTDRSYGGTGISVLRIGAPG